MNKFAAVCVASGLLFASLALTLSAQQHTKDPLDAVKKSVTEKKAVLLDVREQSEWDAGHLKDAKFVPLSIINDKTKTAEFTAGLPKDQPIYLHCSAGKRCVTAAGVLQKLGYDARPIREGFKELLKAGFVQAGK